MNKIICLCLLSITVLQAADDATDQKQESDVIRKFKDNISLDDKIKYYNQVYHHINAHDKAFMLWDIGQRYYCDCSDFNVERAQYAFTKLMLQDEDKSFKSKGIERLGDIAFNYKKDINKAIALFQLVLDMGKDADNQALTESLLHLGDIFLGMWNGMHYASYYSPYYWDDESKITIKPDVKKARAYFQRAVSVSQSTDYKARIEALYRLSIMCKRGTGGDIDYKQTRVYCQELASQKRISVFIGGACKVLGDIYYFGKDVDVDYACAKEYYEKAIKNGGRRDTAWSNLQLARMFDDGIGVEKDLKQASTYYRKAAKQRFHPIAQAQANLRLGDMCMSGQGMKKNMHNARKYYSKAVETKKADEQTIEEARSKLHQWERLFLEKKQKNALKLVHKSNKI